MLFLTKNISNLADGKNSYLDYLIALGIIFFAIIFSHPFAVLANYLLSLVKVKKQGIKEAIGRNLLPSLRRLFVLIGIYFAFFVVLDLHNKLYLLLFQAFTLLLSFWAISFVYQLVKILLSFSWEIKGESLSPTDRSFYLLLCKLGASFFYIYAVLAAFGVNVSSLVAGLGIGSLAISLAAKDTLSNLLAGFALRYDQAFEVGDVVKTEELEGSIDSIGMRSSKIRAYDQALISVPNSLLADNPVYNISKMEKRRIKLNFNLPANLSLAKYEAIKQGIIAFLEQRELVLKDQIRVVLEEMAQEDFVVLIYYFISDLDYQKYVEEREAVLIEIMRLTEVLDLRLKEGRIKVQ